MDELLKIISSLPYNQFKQMVEHYSKTNATSFSSEMDSLVTISLQEKLIKLGINSNCPVCGSKKIVKDGKRKEIQLFKCKDCIIEYHSHQKNTLHIIQRGGCLISVMQFLVQTFFEKSFFVGSTFFYSLLNFFSILSTFSQH